MTDNKAQNILYIEDILRDHMALFGYEPILIPVIEEAEIFLTRAGDTIIDRLFTFDRFGHELALRPEFTASVARHYVHAKHNTVKRWQYSGVVFEDFADDHTLQFEKQSMGAELIGQSGAVADAEIIAMAVQGVEKLGISNYRVIIGHVGLQVQLLSQFGLDSRTERVLLAQRETLRRDGFDASWENVKQILSFSDNATTTSTQHDDTQTQEMLDVLLDSTKYGATMGGRSRHDIAQRLLAKHEHSAEEKQIRNALEFLAEWGQISVSTLDAETTLRAFVRDEQSHTILEQFTAMLDLLNAYGVDSSKIVIQADLAKNWEYYTGVVFGIDVGDDDFVASGGRYDSLVGLLDSNQDVPAVGFAYFVDTIADAVHVENVSNNILRIYSDNAVLAIELANVLRGNDIPAVLTDTTDANVLVNPDFIQFANNRYETIDALVEALR